MGIMLRKMEQVEEFGNKEFAPEKADEFRSLLNDAKKELDSVFASYKKKMETLIAKYELLLDCHNNMADESFQEKKGKQTKKHEYAIMVLHTIIDDLKALSDNGKGVQMGLPPKTKKRKKPITREEIKSAKRQLFYCILKSDANKSTARDRDVLSILIEDPDLKGFVLSPKE